MTDHAASEREIVEICQQVHDDTVLAKQAGYEQYMRLTGVERRARQQLEAARASLDARLGLTPTTPNQEQ